MKLSERFFNEEALLYKYLHKYSKILKVILFLLCLCLLTYVYYTNSFGVADLAQFETWQRDSESFVIGRMIKSRQSGLLTEYGLLQTSDGDMAANFVNDSTINAFRIYTSQIGLQGFVAGVINYVSPLDSSGTLQLIYILNVLCLSLLILLFALWAGNEFNPLAGLFVIIGCVMSPWLTFTARNLYWSVWTMLFPFIVILYLLQFEYEKRKISQWMFFALAFVVVFIRAACGFEFISTVLVSIELPVIYYAVKERWDIKRYITRSIFIGVGGLAAFFSTVLINLWQRVMFTGSFDAGISDFVLNIDKRTGFFKGDFIDAYGAEVAGILQNSLNAPLTSVIDMYMKEGTSLVFNYSMWDILLLSLILLPCIFISQEYAPLIKQNRHKQIALAILAYGALAAPMSWFVLAKGHSAIHTGINYMLWFFPSALIIFAFSGSVVFCLFKGIWAIHNHILKRAVILCIVCGIFIKPIYQFYNVQELIANAQKISEVKNNGILAYEDAIFSIYYQNNSLYYFVEKEEDVSQPFFLHLNLKNTANLPESRVQYGFDNRDFVFEVLKWRVPFWTSYNFAQVELPQYAWTNINTGQYDDVWTASIESEKVLPVPSTIKPVNLSDHNWTNGIKKDGMIVLLPYEQMNYDTLKGKSIVNSDGRAIVIVDVVYAPANWVHVLLEKPIDISMGYPSEINIK